MPPDSRPGIALPRGLAPLGYRNFALYWSGQAGSSVGNWMENTGVVWVLYELTSSPLLLGLVGVFRAVPFIVLAPFAGALADRWDQRKMLFVSQAAGLVLSLGLGLLIVTGQVQFWHVYLQVAAQSAVAAFNTGARQALFPRLVPRSDITSAVTLNSTAARASGLLGPALGGILIARLGDAAPFLVNAVMFLLLSVGVALMRDVPRLGATTSTMLADLATGLRYLVRTPILMGVLKLETAFALLSMNAVIITIIGRQVLGVDAEGLGQLLAAPGLGAIVAIGLLLWFGHVQRQGRLLYACGISYIGAIVVFALSSDVLLSLAALAFAGAFDATVAVTRNSIMQMAAPPAMRGRIMANANAVNRGLSPLAQTQTGAVAGLIGGPLALAASAAALLVAIVASTLADPTLREFSRDELVEEAI